MSEIMGSVDVVVALDVGGFALEVFFFHLEGRVVDLVLAHQVGQSNQDCPLGVLSGEDVGDDHCLSRLQVPDVEVVHVDDSLHFLELPLEGLGVEVAGSGLHHEEVGVLDDREGGEDGEEGEDVGGDGVEEVPGVPLLDILGVAVGIAQ